MQSVTILALVGAVLGVCCNCHAASDWRPAYVYVDAWTAGKSFKAGDFVRDGSPVKVYKCKQNHQAAAGNEPPTATHWTQLPVWAAGQNFQQGDWTVLNEYPNPFAEINGYFVLYKCKQNHQAAAGNSPPTSTHWELPEPKDPPVSTGGDGPTGDEWWDYREHSVGDSAVVLLYRRGGTSSRYPAKVLRINSCNPNFTVANNRVTNPGGWAANTDYALCQLVTAGGKTYQARKAHTSNGDNQPPNDSFWASEDEVPWVNANVMHDFYSLDYAGAGGGTNPPSKPEGDAFFDWAYSGFNPVPQKKAGNNPATAVYNCFAHALDEYKAATTVATNWTSNMTPASGSKYLGELKIIAGMGKNGNYDTIPGDRCFSINHMWIIVTSAANKPATTIEWKDNSSAVYTWTHAAGNESNCAPDGYDTRTPNTRNDDFHETFMIFNKTSR